MAKVAGVGSLVVDVTAYAPHLPVHGETTVGTMFRMGPGGKGSNQITAAHRAGAEAVIISKVGNDFMSEIMLDHYKKEGMTTRHIKTADGVSTGAALIEVDEKSAQNRIIIIKGANDKITDTDILCAEDDFKTCDAVITQLETNIDSVAECMRMAKKYGKPFILNPAPFQKIPEEIIKNADYITPNETEAEFFTGVHIENAADAKKAAAVFIEKGVKNVIITLGKSGVYYTDGKTEINLPAIKVKAVDTTGAGDAFNGAFAAAIAMNFEIGDALRFANAGGALSVTKLGTAPSVAYKKDIYDLVLKEYGINTEKKYE